MTKDSSDIANGLQQLFTSKPELLDTVREIIEAIHNFLYNSENDGIDGCIEFWNECTPEIIEGAWTIPALAAWAEQLEDFKEREAEKALA